MPKLAPLVFDDELTIPIPVGISEYTLVDPKRGAFVFADGEMDSAVVVPLENLAFNVDALPNRRPALFISIPGFNPAAANLPGLTNRHATGIDAWQTKVSYTISPTIYWSQYKHFMVSWRSAEAIQPQVRVLADLVKAFLGPKKYKWDVVIMGHSRGGIFGHELSKRLAGHEKISSLHVWMIEPTAAPLFGDIYPTQLPAAGQTYGYLKYDNRPFLDTTAGGINFGVRLGTDSDREVSGYTNYGKGGFAADINPVTNSHFLYADKWATLQGPNGFSDAFKEFRNRQEGTGGTFDLDGDSGEVLVPISRDTLSSDLFGTCSGNSCTVSGALAIGSIGSVAFDNLVSTDGLDVAVASTVAAASVAIRKDFASAQATDIFSGQSIAARVDFNSGFVIRQQVGDGQIEVTTQLDWTGMTSTVRLLGIDIPLVRRDPLLNLVKKHTCKKGWIRYPC
ncbi:hypothetical protein ASC87_25895 [Rhizobacter sp. Root1221]|nr:hypothetical protein ASC87_25895 [Rhizobacter sp. Root1221]